jgi:hypothetical protein
LHFAEAVEHAEHSAFESRVLSRESMGPTLNSHDNTAASCLIYAVPLKSPSCLRDRVWAGGDLGQ